MRVVLAPVGSRGDVQPMLALAAALKSRGHDVVLCVAENFRALVDAVGVRYARGGDDVRAILGATGEKIANPARFLAIGRDIVRAQFDLLEAACAGADVIVGTAALAAGPTVAERVGARFFFAGFQPQVLPTKELPPMLFAPRWLPRALWPASWAAYRAALTVGAAGIVNDERKKRGLGRVERLDDVVAAAPWLCAFDDALSPAPSDWTVDHHVTDFWFYDDDAPLPDNVARFLEHGDAPVFVSFGSMPNDDPARTTRAIGDALRAFGGRVVVGAGWGGIGAGLASDASLAGRVLVVDGAINHAALFPRCRVIVHHGGAGTTSQAARAGVPQVVVPHMFDQFDWARRAHALDVAPKPLGTRFGGDELARALDEAAGKAAAARALAARMTRSGAERAAALLSA